jgi:hypothetical protein
MLRAAKQCLFASISRITLCLILFGFYNPADAADWPQWRGPNRDAKSSETGLLKRWPEGGPKLVWEISGLGNDYSSLAIANGKLYTMGDRTTKIAAPSNVIHA